jgi:hypothetical protein
MPIIPVSEEVEIRKITVRDKPKQKTIIKALSQQKSWLGGTLL